MKDTYGLLVGRAHIFNFPEEQLGTVAVGSHRFALNNLTLQGRKDVSDSIALDHDICHDRHDIAMYCLIYNVLEIMLFFFLQEPFLDQTIIPVKYVMTV